VIDLTQYANHFDAKYPAYADGPYNALLALTNRYAGQDNLYEVIYGEAFEHFESLLEPLVKIKNYKSQIPFPTDIRTILRVVVDVKRSQLADALAADEPPALFVQLLRIEGFQLPTPSAVFHFCHPNMFPIVDTNVRNACALLKKNHPKDFEDMTEPTLPAVSTSPANRWRHYRSFVVFLDRVIDLQRAEHGGLPGYRFVDRALMVLGSNPRRR
jgi:hypothetical protein